MTSKVAIKVNLLVALILLLALSHAPARNGLQTWMAHGDTARTEELITEVDARQNAVIEEGLQL